MKRIIFTSLLIVGFSLGLVGSTLNAANPEFTTIQARLMIAIATDNNETVHQIVGENPHILNASLPEGKTFLMIAAQAGNKTVVDLCIENSADLTAQDDKKLTAAKYAGQCGHTDLQRQILTTLLKQRNPPTNSSASAAASAAASDPRPLIRLDGVEFQLTNAISNNHIDNVRLLIQHNPSLIFQPLPTGVTFLMMAADKGYYEITDFLLKQGAFPNSANDEGLTALMLAARANHKDVVDLLIKNGANLNTTDKKGHTAFWHASNNGHKALAQKILYKVSSEHELDKQSKAVDGCDTKMQATVELRKALEQKKPVQDVIAALEKGASPDVQLSGKNALIVSAGMGRIDYVVALLKYNADPFISHDGRDAIMAAKECGRRDICRIISAARKFNNEDLYKKLTNRDHQ